MFFPAISELEPIARAAGDIIMAIYSQPFTVEYKGDESPLTAADKGAHEVIVQALTGLTPDIPVLSEESAPEVMGLRHGWSRYWLVDPLDGTKEFVSRNGEFTVNIALIEDGKPLWGLVYAPVLDRLWYGGKGMGTWRVADGKREAIQTLPHQEGAPWRVVGSRNHLSQATLDYLARFGDIERGEIELVSMGSSLKFCIIAEGGAELYPRLAPTCEWDTAAAQAVLEGAGGSVTQLDGSPLAYNKPDILNPWFVARA
ncbi:adenosine-3'(2'),5'-bisphosphate nucleotidase [Aeromonas salmonicida subsp. salmonicida]|uniref:3'(2'),5'-bisphosphate nucleotidase CysQ n=2 Tax=Aeromonas salmonicida subsp. salmonicida TaxID=29491 RepID=A4SJ97_AERS4|nr:3'(2'),5'-bisphosphate nucleotidase CysQ [Aeromonas salmonicida]ABO88969.1 cysQ protein [Aeromonas salmonicida subsp. salmonicida A449]ASI24593.1 3'(2'),5'-bisphosphate nucleotidase CysQ [Aeromonas salmonicida]ASI28912.1 3'(2'),5'-bisphosphate nucleotidase CysQ [Aeromonas salmonicida]ASI33042.1 3'(2'),5'-bisphosphate nucleotidase CysQ [Aeromonas salmonicida]ATD36616.1 3'(2'),5'-bisphosphate nucleotidase [Aeromonas salmonicida subsp. masoucida]